MSVEDRAALVVLRQGSATPHGEGAPAQAKEIVNGVGNWSINANECLELYSAAKELVATFRDWSFVKFMDAKK
jgi:hypothetical protein